MYKLFAVCSIFLSSISLAQTVATKPIILYGQIKKDSLSKTPFAEWFKPGYDDYHPDAGTITILKNQQLKDITIQVFLGTWCGDSKREVPRFMKLLNDISFPENKVTMIAVGSGDSLYKQSPQHEEAGKGIFRVPTFIIYKNGVEINRINEYPVNSLEKDLLQIITHQSYDPNYHSFRFIRKWLTDGTFADENISARGMAGQVESILKSENELNSLGYLLLKQGRKKEALKVFQINYYLFPASANIASSLGEGYYETGDYKKAVNMLERSLELNKDAAILKEILPLLYKAKEKEKG